MLRTLPLLLAVLFAAPALAQLPSPGPGGYTEEGRDFGVPVQAIVHQGPPHAPTPLSLPGATTIATTDLYAKLMARQPVVLIYVNETGDAIQGSHWLYGAGRGTGFDDAIEERLRRKLEQLTQGNRNAAIVTYCFDSHCWLSYNAALRAAQLGYRNVYWYRGGREAWRTAGLPFAPVAQEGW
jgi:rhodanese-related sulfurtransferase